MINFTKELFVGLCRNANSYVEQTHKRLVPKHIFSQRLEELSGVYVQLLGFESMLSRLENNEHYDASRVNSLKHKIINLKLVISDLECSTDV